jgi:uncharacterized protein
VPNFVDRERELAALGRSCGERPGLAVVSGRRRVGKTALLDRFAHDFGPRAVFLPGTRAPVSEALRRLEERVRAAIPPQPGDLLDLGHFATWDAALGYLRARAEGEPLLLVLDEFPYLCEADPALPSTLQARWDHRGGSQLSVVLAGSHVGLMEGLLAAEAPLFGRADAHIRLAPFGWREAALLVGGHDPEAWLEAYCTVGGMPRYLWLWDHRHDALTNLADLLDGPGAPLGDEGTVVLQELPPGSAPARVLELVALGADTFTVLRNRAGLAPATTSEALTLLEGLGFVDRLTPAGQDPRRTRRVRYQVRDPLLRLWLSVVVPYRDAFELGRGASALAAARPAVTESQQRTLEAVARSWLAEQCGSTASPWWTGDGVTVEAVAGPGRYPDAAAAARWATGVNGADERRRIRAALPHPPGQIWVLARSGSDVVTPADLYAAE